jgi:hypothetical protein
MAVTPSVLYRFGCSWARFKALFKVQNPLHIVTVIICGSYSSELWPAYRNSVHTRAIFWWNIPRVWKLCSYAGHILVKYSPRMKTVFIRGPYSSEICPAYGNSVHMRAIFQWNMPCIWKKCSYMVTSLWACTQGNKPYKLPGSGTSRWGCEVLQVVMQVSADLGFSKGCPSRSVKRMLYTNKATHWCSGVGSQTSRLHWAGGKVNVACLACVCTSCHFTKMVTLDYRTCL